MALSSISATEGYEQIKENKIDREGNHFVDDGSENVGKEEEPAFKRFFLEDYPLLLLLLLLSVVRFHL